jgi:Glycosyl transferase family 2
VTELLQSPFAPPDGYSGPPSETPRVTCLLVSTGDRHALTDSLLCFERQDYPVRDLLVLAPTEAELPPHPYVRLVAGGEGAEAWARALETSDAPLVAVWEDATWYPPWRLSVQVEALLRNGLEIAGERTRLCGPAAAGQLHREERTDRLARATLCATRREVSALNLTDEWINVPMAATTGADLCALTGGDHRVAATLDRLTTPERERLDRIDPSGPRLISCVMPTFQRRGFLARAVRYFLAQDHPAAELIVVDDSPVSNVDLIPQGAHVQYVHLDRRASIGAKRNLACELAAGDVIVQWDDDDWYASRRVSRQVASLVGGRADLTGLLRSYLLDVRGPHFFACDSEVARAIAGGTLAFTRELWLECGGYPDDSLGEDLALVARAAAAGARASALANDGLYVYVRHAGNSSCFGFDLSEPSSGWTQIDRPSFFPASDLPFYESTAGAFA